MNKISHAARVVLILAAFASGCTTPEVRLSVEPPKDIDRNKGREISARACGFQLFQLVPIATNERQTNAYEEMKRLAGDDYIGSVSVTEDWYYGVIGSVYCTTFKAKAYPRAGA